MGQYLMMLVKFLLALLLFPLLFATIYTMDHHLNVYPGTYRDFFYYGIVGFLVVFLFVYQFWGVYDFGQRIMADMVKFTAPLDRYLVNLLPFFLLLTMLLFYINDALIHFHRLDPYFLFFTGFFLAMHLLLVAQELQEEEKTPFKPSYLFHMQIIFIFIMGLFVLYMDLIIGKWTFDDYVARLFSVARHMYSFSFANIPRM